MGTNDIDAECTASTSRSDAGADFHLRRLPDEEQLNIENDGEMLLSLLVA